MLSGIHAPNSEWLMDDYCRFRLGAFTSCKLMPYHSPIDVEMLSRMGCRKFLVRLPDSVDPNGRWKGDEEWANECVHVISKFSPLGIKDYQLDNEPNVTWPEAEAPTWRWLVGRVVSLIRSAHGVPGDIRLGLAPLSWTPKTWHSVQNVWVPEQLKLVRLHQFQCVHSYWQKAEHYNLPPFGGNATHFYNLFEGRLPIMVTEWANSSHELGKSPAEVEAIRLEQYPRWFHWAKTLPYIEASYLYILGGTSDWAGFWPTDRVLRALPNI